jgi:hypothetical protein
MGPLSSFILSIWIIQLYKRIQKWFHENFTSLGNSEIFTGLEIYDLDQEEFIYHGIKNFLLLFPKLMQ